MILEYLGKMKGHSQSPPRANTSEVVWSWTGSFLGILAIALIQDKVISQSDMVMVIGSFGASAVLIYGAIKSPLAQPRNLIGGHVISALIGVTCFKLFPGNVWLASSLAVSTSIAVMQLTKTLHPPGGATALIAVIGSSKIHALGYMYAVVPVGLGATIMLIIALIVNNIPKTRRYPEFWI
jgi:CBS-domain-containing membrane protein